MILERRKFLTGLASLIAAPAIVRVSSLMPVRGIVQPLIARTELPQSTWRTYNELIAITRRGFIPRLHILHYAANPMLVALQEDFYSEYLH